MAGCSTNIDFTIGSRRLLSVGRDLATWSFSLEEILQANGAECKSPHLGTDGLLVLSAPQSAMPAIRSQFPDHVIGGEQRYRRHYIDMRPEACSSFEDYLACFSSKTRSTLRRKQRKLVKEAGEGFSITEHRSPDEIEAFLGAALPLSAKTYQARLLDAGLPDTPEARAEMLTRAEAGQMRCYLLHAKGLPVAYLSLPIIGQTLIYAHLGYDPAWSRFSPGTVLQMEALDRLFAEGQFTYFDFTEGEGTHKAMFGTDSVDCVSFVLLEPTLTNRALLSGRAGFDQMIAKSKSLAEKTGALSKVRRLLRA